MAKKEKDVRQKNGYFKEMRSELKKVVWPTPKELLNNTVAVIAFTVIIAVIVFVLDLGFDNLNKYGIVKLQEKVQTSFKSVDDSDEENKQEDSEKDEDSDETKTENDNEQLETIEEDSNNTENSENSENKSNE